MTPDELLDKGADYLEEHGWVAGSAYGLGKETCALGALAAVEAGDVDGAYELSTERERACRALLIEVGITPHRLHSHVVTQVHGWNDQVLGVDEHGRVVNKHDATEVIDTMRHAAKRLRGGA